MENDVTECPACGSPNEMTSEEEGPLPICLGYTCDLCGYRWTSNTGSKFGDGSNSHKAGIPADLFKKMQWMINNGLGWEDMKSDITYPQEM